MSCTAPFAHSMPLSLYDIVVRGYATSLHWHACLGDAAVRRRTRDRKVAGSTPGRGAIKSTRSTQPSIPPV